jgi:hypothetical protein
MSTERRTNDGEHFLRAVVSELGRVVNGPRDTWTVQSHLPVIPHAAQLLVLARLLLKGADKHWGDVFKHREKFDALLAKAHERAKHAWGEALPEKKPAKRTKQLNDAEPIEAAVNKVVNFADRTFGLHDTPLIGFTDNVQDTLAGLVGRITTGIEVKLQSSLKAGAIGQVPWAVLAATTLSGLAGGLVGRREMTPKELSAARIAVTLGSQKDETGGPEPKEVRRLRKTLKELGPHLPEQRG